MSSISTIKENIEKAKSKAEKEEATNNFANIFYTIITSENIKETIESLGDLIHTRDENGSTLIHLLVLVKSNYIETLVKAGVDPDTKNKNGETPLQIAIKKQAYRNAQYIIDGCILRYGIKWLKDWAEYFIDLSELHSSSVISEYIHDLIFKNREYMI